MPPKKSPNELRSILKKPAQVTHELEMETPTRITKKVRFFLEGNDDEKQIKQSDCQPHNKRRRGVTSSSNTAQINKTDDGKPKRQCLRRRKTKGSQELQYLVPGASYFVMPDEGRQSNAEEKRDQPSRTPR